MRSLLILAGLAALIPAAAHAQRRDHAPALRGAADTVRQAAPTVAGVADAFLDLDVGPLLDAADPYGPRGRHRTLRALAGRGDPGFDRRLNASIRDSGARIAAALDAMAAAEPGIRRSLAQLEAGVAAALESAPGRLPPAEVDDDWDPELEDAPPPDEPY